MEPPTPRSSNRNEATPAPARWSASTANSRKPPESESLSWSPLPLIRTTAACGPSPSGNVNSPARTMSPLEKTTSSRRNDTPSPSSLGSSKRCSQKVSAMLAWVNSPSITPSRTSPSQMARPMGESNSKWMRPASSTTFDSGKPDTPWMSIVPRRPSPDAVTSTAKGRSVGPGIEIAPSQCPSRSADPTPVVLAASGASGSAGACGCADWLVAGVLATVSTGSGAGEGLATVSSATSAAFDSAGGSGSAGGSETCVESTAAAGAGAASEGEGSWPPHAAAASSSTMTTEARSLIGLSSAIKRIAQADGIEPTALRPARRERPGGATHHPWVVRSTRRCGERTRESRESLGQDMFGGQRERLFPEAFPRDPPAPGRCPFGRSWAGLWVPEMVSWLVRRCVMSRQRKTERRVATAVRLPESLHHELQDQAELGGSLKAWIGLRSYVGYIP